MGAPCINDTCSITSRIDPVTRRLEINAIVNDKYGLDCVEPNGIKVKVIDNPDPATPIDTAFQQLGVDLSGNLFSIPKRARIHSFSSSTSHNIPQGTTGEGDLSPNAINVGSTITNPYASQATVLFVGQYKIGFSVMKTGAPSRQGLIDGGNFIPYHADITCLMQINSNNVNTSKAWFDIGGVVSDDIGNINKRSWENFSFYTTIGASGTLQLEAYANHTLKETGADKRKSLNISTVEDYGDEAFNDRGFQVSGVAIIFPFTAQVLQ